MLQPEPGAQAQAIQGRLAVRAEADGQVEQVGRGLGRAPGVAPGQLVEFGQFAEMVKNPTGRCVRRKQRPGHGV